MRSAAAADETTERVTGAPRTHSNAHGRTVCKLSQLNSTKPILEEAFRPMDVSFSVFELLQAI